MPQYQAPIPVPPAPTQGLRVYRYFPLIYGLEALQTGVWKIGRMSELNDPFDCRPQFVNDGSQPDNFIDFVMEGWGLLSYSKRITDPVIWSHYADSHRGIALGFDFYDSAPSPVTYAQDKPILYAAEIVAVRESRRETAAAFVFRTGYLTKASSWAYEEEYRTFLQLHDCRMKGVHYFKALPIENLSTVILGARCAVTLSDIEGILSNYKSGPLSATSRKCRMSKSSFKLELFNALDEIDEVR